ncbi:hypothetical protein ACS0TY_025937 [Phlomoides rotata]
MEGNSSGTSRESWFKDGFINLLFSWSIEDIFDENLYQLQVEKIPDSFESVDQYLASYVFPLLEETRFELASALETVYNAPYAEVTYFRELTHETGSYNVKVDRWENRTSDRGKDPYRTLPGDFVLLSVLRPESVSDLIRAGWSYTFAYVTKISEDESGYNSTLCGFKLKTARDINFEDVKSKSLYVVHLTNITTQKRIWSALRMRRNLGIIEKVLTKNDTGHEHCEICPYKCNTEVEEKFGSALLSTLNESQRGSILATLRKIGCSHQPSVELIWGPPGTGKTSTLSALLYILLKMKVRTLVCAPTNIAITELVSRVAVHVRKSFKSETEKSQMSCPLGDVLVFGNKDNLKVGSDIQEILLDYRVERLLDCLVPLTGWKHCISTMLDFLEDCVSHYQIFIENEKIKSNDLPDAEVQQSVSQSFLEFARLRFTHVASPVRQCLLTLFTHLPRSFIQEENYQSIVQLISLLGNLEKLLFKDNMTSSELEMIFLQQTGFVPDSLVDTFDTSSLQYIRSQCRSILRSLQASLSKLGLPLVTAKNSTSEFCLQKASLVFCTISSSFKLHSVDIEPFHFLVIDEAAQVKECETSIALQLPHVKHAILVGDECQLPATVASKLSEEAGFGRSLFERLSSMGHSKHLLNMQYRMHPSISRFPNSNFYDNQILNAPNVRNKSYERCYLQGRMFGSYSFINVCDGREELDDVGHSRRNMVEVAVILKILRKLYKEWSVSKEKLSIGLISPYAAQVAAIHDRLPLKYENFERFTVKVKSIDGFQGGEEDIIIISTVRSHRGGSIGFLSSPQRTNVALTRARHCLWIIGNERTLSQSESVWARLVSDAKDRKCFFNAGEDCDLDKTIIDVKKEMEQLDDLLNEDSTHFKNLRWQVLFSDNFRKSFQKLKFPRVKNLAIKYLMKLASGWRPKKINVDRKCENSSYVLKLFKVDIYHVVCSIDIVKDTIYKQVLKVWDILPMNETTKLFKRLDSIFSMYTDNFIKLCNEKLFDRNLEVPKSWSFSNDIMRFKNPNDSKLSTGASTSSVDCRSYVENSKVSESLLLMKFYSLSIGVVNHLLSDLEGRELDLPFEVTDEEREIINFPRSSFILGRSGTGKTTILTMKLYKRLQQYCLASEDSVAADSNVNVDGDLYVGESMETTLHQLFVTVSPKLCYAVKNHVSQLKSFATENFSGSDVFAGMDDVDEMAEFKDIPDTFLGIEREKYPLIITFHKFLMMLDGTLGNSYFQRFHEVRDTSHYENRRSIALQTFMRNKGVTYDQFRSLYWPHFNAKLTKNLDSSRVFTEIMSHIKGGLQDDDACDFKRSRQDYISLSDSRISTLSEEIRDVIYDIFEDYEKMKLERCDFDLSDFVNDIHLRIKNEDLLILGDKMDFVYIDEVQDLSMRQISLFRYICKNVDEGFVFSGDTAQTIARGIDFRFEDIRSLFYTEFLMKSRNSDISGRKEKGLISDMFNLSQNFRTHTGVLRLAQSVIDLICHYFPQSIDSLPPETSLIYGESPVVLEPGSDENLIMSIFGHGRKCGEKWVGFGADQVILVRDDSARKEISSYVGQQALVLTILECKGLEFQDVLLYNFFGSSPLSNQWRVVYEFLKEKDLLDGDSSISFPSFSQSRHNILCSELKQLYVAITRTRQRLWICENNVELSKPMLDYWRRLCLVQVTKIDDSLAAAMQRASTPEEWKSQGIKLFWEKNYEMAMMCFEKAGEETWEKRAKASRLRAAADSLRSSNPEEANIMLIEAAEIFDSIDRVESAAQCFCDLGDYERAGRIYLEKCGTSELKRAGECFCLAGNYKTAAEVYARGNFFRECLSTCTKGNCYDLGLQYIEYWKEQASLNSSIMARFKEIDKIAQEFLESCALERHNAKDSASLMKFVRAFNSTESKRSFLKSLDYLEGLLVLEEELGNFSEAAEIAKSLGDILHEVDLLEKAKQFANACLLILSYVLSNSLWISGNRGWPPKSSPQKADLLKRATLIAQKVSETFHASTCAEVNILSCEQRNMSDLMLCYSSSKQYGTPIGEILSVRKLLDTHIQLNTPKPELDPVLHLDPTSFEDRISRNQASSGTLFYLWNLWKLHSLNILECLDDLERSDFVKPEGAVRFCLNYFGVRLLDDFSVTFHLMNPDAAWVRNVDKGFMRKNRNVTTLEARHFASAARKYWHQEFVSVGLKVLEALQGQYKSLTVKRLSKYCQSICLLQIFDVAKFFLESKAITMNGFEARKLQDSLQLSTNYIAFVFPLDSRESISENMISLRETLLSKNLLEEIVSRDISKKGELTYGQIGRSVMIMLGTSELKHGIYDDIVGNSKNTSWKSFVKNLKGIMESYSSKETESIKPIKEGAVSDASSILPGSTSVDELSHSECVQDNPLRCFDEALSREFHIALEETYNVHWRAFDYISPHCFFYLVERLLIVVPHSQGYFFTPKSSFVEYLMSLPSGANPGASIVTDAQYYSTNIFNFVVRVVQECLSNSMVTAEWIKTCHIDCKYYFPVLLLRLFVILCSSCLNSGFSFSVIFDLLRLSWIGMQLPKRFCEALRSRRRNDYIPAVAEAFKAVRDPLVIVASSENTRKFFYPAAIFLELRSFTSREEIMEALFPRRPEVSPSTAETNVTKSVNIVVSSVVSDKGKSTTVKSLVTPLEMESNLSSETGKGILQINWSLIRELFDALESLRNENSENSLSLVLRKKLELGEHMNSLTGELTKLTEKWSHSAEDKVLLSKVSSMIEDLNALSSLMATSDLSVETWQKIEELLKSLEARQPQLDTVLSQFAMENDPNGAAVSEEIEDHKNSDSSRDIDDSKVDVTNLRNQEAESTKGKGKSKKGNKKPKKGKGRKK